MSNDEESTLGQADPAIHPQAQALAAGVASLASLPGACVRVMQMADDPETSSSDIGEVVSLDPGLSARLLKLVNSAYYTLPRKVDSIVGAIHVVGTNALRNLALGTGALSAFDGIPNTLVDMETFWNTSVYCALAARELGKAARQADPERNFVLGLLHAVGQLVMYNREAAKSSQVLKALRESARTRAQIECEVFGYTHAEVGAALLAAWKLPESLVIPVRHQMTPGAAGAYCREAANLHIAIAMSEALCGTRMSKGQALEPQLFAVEANIWPMAGLVQDVAMSVSDVVDAQWFEVIEILSPGGTLIY